MATSGVNLVFMKHKYVKPTICSTVDWFVFSNIDEDEAFFQKIFLELSENEACDYPRVYGGLESLTWS